MGIYLYYFIKQCKQKYAYYKILQFYFNENVPECKEKANLMYQFHHMYNGFNWCKILPVMKANHILKEFEKIKSINKILKSF